MQTYSLFRLKALRSHQKPLFFDEISRSAFLERLIDSKPSGETRAGYAWHIGNVQKFDPIGIAFAVGKTTLGSKDLYDEDSKNFIEVEDELSPFTTAIFDGEWGILAIASKTKLSASVKSVASNLEKLLNSQHYVIDNGVRIEIAEIWDPDNFIAQISKAHSIKAFSAEFGNPNPFDVNEDFHKPMEKFLDSANGSKGKTTINGENLDKNQIKKIARSVASTGNEATAKIQETPGSKPKWKHMKGDQVTVTNAEPKNARAALNLIRKMRDAYSRIRNS